MAFDFLPAWRAALTRPDAMLLDLGARGERVLARVRLGVAASLLAWPPVSAWTGAAAPHVAVAFALVFAFLVGSVVLVLRTQRAARLHRVPFASTAFDIGMGVACIAAIVVQDAAAGFNATGAWLGLGAAIGGTALRADARTTALAGALAVGAVPLLVVLGVGVHGVAGFDSLDHGHVDAGDLLLRAGALALLAWLVAAGLHAGRRLVEVSGTDTLTGLPNRTWLLQRMPQLLEIVDADGGGLTVAIVDLDHLHRLNDEHGHQAGDRALLALASALRTFAQGGDWLVRLSGGEFLLLVRQPVGATWERLDALRRMFSERGIDVGRGLPLHATFSGGLAGFPHDGRDLSQLLRRADERLQLTRAEGRNRVIARH